MGPEPTGADLVGDWNDVRAAAIVAAERVEAAIEAADLSEDRAIFHLRTVGGMPGTLVVTRAGEADRVHAEATIGRFRHPDRERRLLSAFADRLEQLHGVEFAPR